MNPHINQQIVTAYEKCGLTIEEIAENYDLETAAIAAVLSSDSSKYRMDVKGASGGKVTEADVTTDEMREMLSIMKSIAREQRHDNPSVAKRAAEFVYNEGKGRNNLAGLSNTGVNILVINQRLVGMRQAREKVARVTGTQTLEA